MKFIIQGIELVGRDESRVDPLEEHYSIKAIQVGYEMFPATTIRVMPSDPAFEAIKEAHNLHVPVNVSIEI
jgi:hypothetical protein